MDKKLAAVVMLLLVLGGVWWSTRAPDDTPFSDPEDDAELLAGLQDAPDPSLAVGAKAEEAPATPDARTVMVRGRVFVAGTQKPIPGARVRAFSYAQQAIYETVTDDVGHFALPETEDAKGPHHLVVTHAEHAGQVVRHVFASQDPLSVGLDAGGWLTGRVVDADDNPVTAYHIRAHSTASRGHDLRNPHRSLIAAAVPASVADNAAKQVVSADGTFRIGPLGAGKYTLVVAPTGRHPLRFPTKRITGLGFEVAADADRDVGTLQLGRDGAITVWVVDSKTGERLDDVVFEGRTSAKGGARYPMEVLGRTRHGAYRIAAYFRDKRNLSGGAFVVKKAGYVDGKGAFNGAPPRRGLVVRMQRGGTQHVVARLNDGSPAAGSVVYVRRTDDHTLVHVQTLDENGRLETRLLPPGVDLQLFVLDPQLSQVLSTARFTVRNGANTPIRIGGSDVTAIAGTVRVRGRPEASVLVVLDSGERQRTRVMTSADGSFRLDNVPAGVATLFYNVGEHRAMVHRGVQIEEGQVTDASLDLKHVLKGQVVFVGERLSPDFGEPGVTFEQGDPKVPGGVAITVRLGKDDAFSTLLPTPGTYRAKPETVDYSVDREQQIEIGEDPILDARVVLTRDPGDTVIRLHVIDAKTKEPLDDVESGFVQNNTSGWRSSQEKGVVDMLRMHLGPVDFKVSAPGYVEAPLRVTVEAQPKLQEHTVALHRANALRITKIKEEGQAAEVGLKVGDVVTHYAGEPIPSRKALGAAMIANARSSVIVLKARRGDESLEFELKPGPIGIDVRLARVE